MAVTREDISRFQAFAEDRIASGNSDSMEDLFRIWLLSNPSPEQAAADLKAIDEGVQDADAGRVVPIEQAFDDVRRQVIADR